MALGIVGSFIGGFLGYALFGHDFEEGALQPSGIIGSVIGAVLALLAYRAASRRRDAQPLSLETSQGSDMPGPCDARRRFVRRLPSDEPSSVTRGDAG